MAGDMRKFHASIKDLKSKIERYMEQYGNSMGTLDKNDFSLILGEKPGFSQNNVAICRLIAWNVLLHRDAPELDKEVVDWANAMRVYTHVVDYPAVYRMDSIDDLRHLNAMAHLSMQYMRNESDRRQANCYKTYEDVEKYASNPKESLQYRSLIALCITKETAKLQGGHDVHLVQIMNAVRNQRITAMVSSL